MAPWESASKRAGVAQSPDGRRAIIIYDPPLMEPCREEHMVRARHPEGYPTHLCPTTRIRETPL